MRYNKENLEEKLELKDGIAMGIAFFQLIFPFIILVTGIMAFVTWIIF